MYLHSDYRYGFNGMEKDDEVKGQGNHMTTPFRQYDTRIGRWMTTDPIVHIDQSPYMAFNNNPIYFADPSGLKGQGGPGGDDPDGSANYDCGDVCYDEENQEILKYKGDGEWKKVDHLSPIDVVSLLQNEGIPVNDLLGEDVNDAAYEGNDIVQIEVPAEETVETITVTQQGNNSYVYATLLTTTLVADDATVVGVFDDIAIPFIWAYAWWSYTAPTTSTYTSTYTPTTSYRVYDVPVDYWYVTYTKTNIKTGEVYVGRSSGYGLTPQDVVNRRENGHHMNQKIGGYTRAKANFSLPATIPGGYVTRGADPSYWAIRGSEQIQINEWRASPVGSANTINGIGIKNPNHLKYLMEIFRHL